jgi:hypothetical protein
MSYKTQKFKDFNEINDFFKKYNSISFVDWFNKNIAKEQSWNGITIKKEQNWQKIWSNIKDLFGRETINLIEFLCINSIITNETGGNFTPLTESVGSNGNPGLSYAFNKITGTKKSYNTLSTNKSAFELFNDPLYIAAHSTKPFGSFLKNTNDNRWHSDLFPLGFSGKPEQETNISGKMNGFIFEADFMKFRGRGYIQLTGRENYKSIIDFVKKYEGDNATINDIRNSWKSHSNLDDIATISTNNQWDKLFRDSDSVIPNYSCYIHNNLPSRYKNYNKIDPNQSDVNLHKSISNVGLAISGSSAYSNLFLQRVLIQLKKLESVNIEQPTDNKPKIEDTNENNTYNDGGEYNDNSFTKNVSNEINGSLSNVTNIFKPTIKPGPISFNMDGNG